MSFYLVFHLLLIGGALYFLFSGIFGVARLAVLVVVALFTDDNPQIKRDVLDGWDGAFEIKKAAGTYKMPTANEVYEWMARNGKKYSPAQVREAYYTYVQPTLRAAS